MGAIISARRVMGLTESRLCEYSARGDPKVLTTSEEIWNWLIEKKIPLDSKQQIDVIKGDLCYYGRLVAQRGGYMFVKKKVGQKIKKGDTVIEIVNVYGDRVEEIKMPINGYCWAFTGGVGGAHGISEGDKLAYVFTERSEIHMSEGH